MSLDGEILLWLQSNVRSPLLDPIILFLTGTIPYVVVLFACLLFFKKTRKFAIYVLIGFAVCLLLNTFVIKPFFHRTRPFEAIKGLTYVGEKPGGSSFPSSHTMSAFSLAWMSVWCKKKKWIAPLFVYACVIAFTRLYLGVHYPTDILGGIVFSALITYGAWFVLNKVKTLKEGVR